MKPVIKMYPLRSKVSPNTSSDQIGIHMKIVVEAFVPGDGQCLSLTSIEDMLGTRS